MPIHRLLLIGAALTLPAAGQIPAHALYRPGDVLPNGLVYEHPEEMGVSDLGEWSAMVEDAAGTRCVVRNGDVVLTEGDVLANGATVNELIDMDVDPGGVLAITIEAELGGNTLESVLVEGLPLVFQGVPVTGPGVVVGAVLETIDEAAIAQPHVLVRGTITGATTGLDALVRFTFGQGNPVGVVLVLEGEPAATFGTFGDLPSGRSPIDVLPDGRAFSPITTRSFPDPTRDGYWFDGDIVQLDGEALPVGFGVWATTPSASGFVGQGGEVVLFGDRTSATGAPLPEAVYVDGALFLTEGDPLGSGTFIPATAALTVDRHGRVIWAHEGGTASGVYVDQTPVFPLFGGLVNGSPLSFVRANRGFAASPSGRFIMFEGDETLAAPDSLLCIVESELGAPFNACPAVPNSTGSAGTLAATGSSWVGAGPISLVASNLPTSSLALMLCSRTPAIILNPAGSTGNLCMGGSIGRFVAQIGFTSATGTFEVTADAELLPSPTGLVTASAGQLWGFQTWHRDSVMGGVTTNFTGTIGVLFR